MQFKKEMRFRHIQRSPLQFLKRWGHLWYLPASAFVFLSILGAEYAHAYQAKQVVSFELRDLAKNARPRSAVSNWLSVHSDLIVKSGRRWGVDPIAIAGVIAYEALENPLPLQLSPMFRFSGPGKVHYKEFYLSEGDPVSKQIEDDGYLPARTEDQRRDLLQTDSGSILYITVIMRLYADMARRAGFDVAARPDILATLYSAWTPVRFKVYLTSARGRAHDFTPNVTGAWVDANRDYLVSAIAHTNAY